MDHYSQQPAHQQAQSDAMYPQTSSAEYAAHQHAPVPYSLPPPQIAQRHGLSGDPLIPLPRPQEDPNYYQANSYFLPPLERHIQQQNSGSYFPSNTLLPAPQDVQVRYQPRYPSSPTSMAEYRDHTQTHEDYRHHHYSSSGRGDYMKTQRCPTTLEALNESYAGQLPSLDEFQYLLNDYINSLSPKKQDKALIPLRRYDNIRAVLQDPKCTTIESAQFRFWSKKMFKLQNIQGVDRNGNSRMMATVTHEDRPVAVREDLYIVLTNAHIQAQHGGRDKTSSQVRRQFSWVPKELIARFVKACPQCKLRRTNPTTRQHQRRKSTSPGSRRRSQSPRMSPVPQSPFLSNSAASTPSPQHNPVTPPAYSNMPLGGSQSAHSSSNSYQQIYVADPYQTAGHHHHPNVSQEQLHAYGGPYGMGGAYMKHENFC